MATTEQTEPTGSAEAQSKGLRPGALGMVTSLILATASAAPAYSLAATLAFVVAAVGFQAPAVVVLAFVPILFVSFGYAALNRSDPDCGTIFTWASRSLGPRIGFMGGWAIIASFVLVMGSLAQVAGQYVFLLFGADGIGEDPSSPWVLAVGLGWIALMTAVCYRGIEVAAAVQRALLFLEFAMLVVFSVVALVRVCTGHAGSDARHPRLSWLDPFAISSPSAFASGLVLMLFIYWGWETALTVNEETADRRRTPGRAATLSTLLLLALYLGATYATLSFAGIGTTGNGLANPDHSGDVFSALGGAVFGTSGFGSLMWHLMVLMVLSSAAASTETTVLTLGRTMLAMARHRALPGSLGTVHPRFSVPKAGTIATGAAGAVVYLAMNFLAHGHVIGDAVSSCGLMIALYYGLTGITSAWAHRRADHRGATELWLRVILPAIGGLTLVAAGVWSLRNDWKPDSGGTSWTLPFAPHWHIGGVFLIGVGALAVGLVVMLVQQRRAPSFFAAKLSAPTLTDATGEPSPPAAGHS
ncbi:APC family permease [Streptomyces sp. NBC_01471]|uniref:APC family permease n=1 Tax=Streptomyces sp. NBC_01471 TaxID=2903879 RepID=UPI0032453D59